MVELQFILGVLGFLVGSILASIRAKEYLDSREKIEIRVHAIGYSHRKRNKQESGHRYGPKGFILPPKIPQLILDFSLTNLSSKPIGIKHIRIDWIKPDLVNNEQYNTMVNQAAQFAADSLTEPFELKRLPIRINRIFEPSAFLAIELGKMKSKERKFLKADIRILTITAKGKKIHKDIVWEFPVSGY